MELPKHLPGLILFLAAALTASGADITPGYTFTSGDSVTHTKLNTAAAGDINTVFFSSQTDISDPATGGTFLILDATSSDWREMTLANLLAWDEWIPGRTDETQPAGGDSFLVYDTSAAAYREMTLNALLWTNAGWFSAISNANPASAEPLQLLTGSNGVYYTLAVSNLSAGLDFSPLTRLTRLTNSDTFLFQRGTTNYAVNASNVVESAFVMHPLSAGVLTNDTLLLLGTNGAVVRANLAQLDGVLATNIGTNKLAAEIRTNLTSGWAVYEAVGNAIVNQSGIFSSVTSNAVGVLTFTFTTARASTNYCVQATASVLAHDGTGPPSLNAGIDAYVASNGTGGLVIQTRQAANGAAHPRRLYLTIIGN